MALLVQGTTVSVCIWSGSVPVSLQWNYPALDIDVKMKKRLATHSESEFRGHGCGHSTLLSPPGHCSQAQLHERVRWAWGALSPLPVCLGQKDKQASSCYVQSWRGPRGGVWPG